jgi:adenine-specific DNA-methyltransferase
MENSMEKLDRDSGGSSLNIVQDNIEKLKTLFPDIFSEGKIDFDALRDLLGDKIETAEERYNFTWHGKSQARRIAQTPSTGTLRPCKAESKDWETTQNLFIEGDNLEVLKLLQKSYHKQVKMIYIDPPYNTGKEFIYPDNYKDNLDTYLEYTGQKDSEGRKFGTNAETSGRYHTNWLNMMYPRLKLARNLLRDDAVIFISIDDNEVANLRKLCDEIFGEENAFVSLIWDLPRGNNAGVITRAHEYILVYAKNIQSIQHFKRVGSGDELINVERCNRRIDSRHPATAVTIPAGIKYIGEDKVFKGELGGNENVFIEGEMIFKNGELAKPVTLKAGWNMKDMMISWFNGEDVYDLKGQKIVDFFFKENGKLYSKKILSVKTQKSILKGLPDTQTGRAEVASLFNEVEVFDYPKPSQLLSYLSSLQTEKEDIVLDFFSGSAPTAHAVMDLNAQDGGNRKFIMVQLPEPCDEKSEAYKAGYKTIADIGKERIRRAGEKILQDNADKDDIENLDIGFKVFKLSSSNIKPWDADFDNLEETLLNIVDNIKEERTEDDVLYEILLKYGLDLTVPIEERQIAGKTVYAIGFGALVICLDDMITLDVVEGIGGLKVELDPEVMRVVFKDSGFSDDVVKTNAIQILKKHGIDDVKSL